MEPRDAIREARLRLKKLAARAEATAEKLRAEKAGFEKQLGRLEAEHAAWEKNGRPEAQEAAALLEELRARLAGVESELAAATRQREEAERESQEVERLVPELERGEVARIARSVLNPAIDEQSPADVALEHVRRHVDQLEAEASLGAELAPPSSSGLDAKPASVPKPDPRAQLEALKAARKKDEAAPKTSSKPKRTM